MCATKHTGSPHLIPWRHPKSIADARKLDRASLLIIVAITEHSNARSWTSFNRSTAPTRNSNHGFDMRQGDSGILIASKNA
jgi:hypothetical protein